jgi:hypothetical protein
MSVPPPHVAEHVPLTHADQLPSTEQRVGVIVGKLCHTTANSAVGTD